MRRKDPSSDIDDYYELDYYDDDYDYDEFYNNELSSNFFHIKDGYADYILKQLSYVPRAPNSNGFKPLLIDNCFVIEFASGLELHNNRFTYIKATDNNIFTISIYEKDMPDKYAYKFMGWDVDFRFKNKSWASKFKWCDANKITLNELVDIIKHCFKLSRLRILI